VGNIKVSYATLTAAAGQFRAAANDIGGALRSMGGVSGVGQAMGPGPAAAAYSAMWNAWQGELSAQQRVLDDLATKLDEAAKAYQHTDQTAVPAGGPH
jgi:WXG100 family type VII secretion target